MANVQPGAQLGIVIRASGEIPFDDDVHPDHKAAMLAHVESLGHEVVCEDGVHRITNWPTD